MEKRQVFIGLFVILVILGIIFGIKKAKESKVAPLDIPTQEEAQELESRFNITLPNDSEKINLQVAPSFEGVGIATRKLTGGTFTHMIIADLPEPEGGSYEGFLIKDDGSRIQTGVLKFAKGGYILEYISNTDYSDYKKVEVKLEDKVVLTGSF